jgi:hypothetical protein
MQLAFFHAHIRAQRGGGGDEPSGRRPIVRDVDQEGSGGGVMARGGDLHC